MKFIKLLPILLLSSSQNFAQPLEVQWTAPTQIADGSFSNSSPRMDLLPGSTPAIVWGKGGSTRKIYFSKTENGAFLPPVEVPTGNFPPDIYDFGGLDVATSGDRVFIVYSNFDNGLILVRSLDGGQTFDPPVKAFDPPAGLWATLPSIAADANGNPLIAFIYLKADESQATQQLLRSKDGGLTFEPLVNASDSATGTYVCECCPPGILAAGDTVWYAFRNNNSNLRDIWLSQSVDGGQSFPNSVDIDESDWNVNVCPTSGPRLVKSNEKILSAWMSKGSGATRVYASSLNINTLEADGQVLLPQLGSLTGTQNRPDIAGKNDTIGMAWEETGFGLNAGEVVFSFSMNGILGFQNQTFNMTNSTGTQKLPALAYDNGVFHLIYADVPTTRLFYRKGVLSKTSAASPEVLKEKVEVSAGFDAASNSLKIKALGIPSDGKMNIRLFASDGREICAWPETEIFSGQGILTLPLNGAGQGLCFLQWNFGGVSGTTSVWVR